MVTTTVSAIFKIPLPELFQKLTNFENMVEYNSSVKSSRLVSSSSELPRYAIDIDMGIKRFQSEYIITEFIENQKIIAYCETNDLRFEDTYIFEEKENGTYFEITDRTSLKGLLSLSEIILRPIMKNQMEANLRKLIEIIEKGK
ncbi:hypothetical protein [Leptospira sp. GIMC2001]|uniref:hypothetical protein n=1 Tax=Leptospira sp. GIMC2001 TaxID=1513297 RepID=UPI00234BB615|nr:hypothetical protein [Leptospira sp. GIMC2001]WCL49330.1 hypothetical protein O4O04_18880 [Leptospira sp. GIMC2001]